MTNSGETTETMTQPDGWLVQFDLPYFVSVQDSMDDPDLRRYAEALDSGEDPEPVPYSPRLRRGTALTIAGGSPLHVPDPDTLSDPFEVTLDKGEVRLAFLRRVNNVDRAMVMLGEMRPDRGTASFSSVQVQFDTELSRTIDTNDLEGAASIAMEATNRFLQQYRYFIGAYWAQPIEFADVPEFLIWRLFADGRQQGPAIYTKPAGGPLIGSGSQPLVDSGKEQEIRSALAQGLEYPFAYEVFLSAKEHVHRSRYRNAVVDAETAFEIFLVRLLRIRLIEAGKSEGAIDAALRDNAGRWRRVEDLARETLRSELGIDFATTVEYRDWKRNVLDVRNGVVHGSAIPATRELATQAIRDAQRAVNKLQDLLQTRDRPGVK